MEFLTMVRPPRRAPWRFRPAGSHAFAMAIVASMAALCLGVSAPPAGADGASLEDAVKATYLSKFAPFVAWPPGVFDADGRLTICLVDDDPVSVTVAQAAPGKNVAGRPMTVRRIPASGPIAGCQILYVASSEPRRAELLTETRDAPVLTVTDGADTDLTKGVVNFVIRDNRVRFEIDNALAAHAGLAISSKLLGVAVSVKPGP